MSIRDEAPYLAAADLRALQERAWRRQRQRLTGRSPFIERQLAGAALPESLDGFAEIPTCDKAMLRASQTANPSYGDYLACEEERVIRLHRTSGTTGEAMNLAVTALDAQLHAALAARSQYCGGLRPHHRVVHCLNYQMWMGGLTDHMGLEALGATVVPFGVGDSERLIRTIQTLGITAISCTPSYPAALEAVIAEKFPGLTPRDLGLELALMGGEGGLDSLDLRRRMEATWGFKVRNSNYGLGDIFCNFASQCEHRNDLHFLGGDLIYLEIVDPESGAPLPIAEGSSGEMVLTHLCKEAQPMLRFRSGDIVEITGTGRCDCGRSAPRFRIAGRSDDMVVVRGVKAFPGMVTAVVAGQAALSGEYRIRLAGPGPYGRLPLEVELAEAGADKAAVAAALTEAIKREIGMSAAVTVLDPGSLPRTAGKTKRVIREPAP